MEGKFVLDGLFILIKLDLKKKKTYQFGKSLVANGQNRTDDIRIFSPPLYQLSYIGK